MSTQPRPPLPPVVIPTPGAGSSDPSVVDQLVLNERLFLEEFERYRQIVNFLNALRDWKLNSEQRVANKLPLLPPPTPPAGYVLPVELPPPPPPAPNFSPIIQPRNQFGIYPGPGDLNPAGAVVANPFQPGATLTKVQLKTPFSDPADPSTFAQYWIDTPAEAK